MHHKAAPYGGMQNGSHGEKEKGREKPNIRWWKLKEISYQEAFRQEVTRILGGEGGLPDETKQLRLYWE